ncbi:hypothetical protein K3N28_13705 [Glycomyces sp. TRM65418]|uniref:hypothetical protein n=1 Tax=Glycomyces sp. TRM65418 TaxID=2867006 RepID=UPI001CE5448A|nr:hypothetical protein [Glycomyces sp. TRM65418]MCC3764120.1 hypothetical protein [Glycomyces sp. TRM65418]QZD53808.1 hypothetical protein K3N28_13640 [Glycomyces sp. TRM65418]
MSRQRPGDAEHEVSRVLRQASDGYGDLPDHVGQRLDRVLETLPAADTLHSDPHPRGDGESVLERLAERLRPKRVRYALISAAAAVLVTVGAVATALQIVEPGGGGDSAGSAEVFAEEHDAADSGVAPGPQDDEAGAQTEASEPETGADGIASVETFATGTDYAAGTDLLAALRELGSESTVGPIPPELVDLAAGGEFWKRCEEAIAREYAALLVAVDFARYDSEPAIMALMVGDSGDMAVALTPACADGVIEPLAAQP